MNAHRDFELLAVTVRVDGRPDVPVPLNARDRDDAPGRAPEPVQISLKEGAEFRLRLKFRVSTRDDLEGLKFIDERTRQGVVVVHTETHLGDFRQGGPYEVVLPPVHLPTGHLARDHYACAGTFVDAGGRELGRETYDLEITKEWPPP
ncbi:hypothetical protein V1460_14690 [Streptomyces sp. SCSIO 30461]|uniref:hypothetical protein n=1 Tax=Streptomyces sp. SCSIO 30461 TaxID=3118085 RepID=UPI0030D4A1CA